VPGRTLSPDRFTTWRRASMDKTALMIGSIGFVLLALLALYFAVA
jgi:hypothetical protein